MSYTPNIPNASDARAESQVQILSNFQSLNSVWAVNHTPLTSTDTQGQHSVLTLRNQSADPTTAANQVALYNKLISSIPELFFRPASNGTPIQLTYPTCTTGTPTIVTTSTYSNIFWQTFVPGPFVIFAGYITTTNPFGLQQTNLVALTPTTNLLYANANQDTSRTDTRAYVSALNSPPGSMIIALSNAFVSGLVIPTAYYFAIGQ